jgi:PP-loop superfamily ATP-utilizing enzyme
MPRALELRDEITAGITAAGYAFVTLDLGGYKAGNLNKLLKPKVIAASTG